MTNPILTYPDPNLPNVLFTDDSKYAWACILTQEKMHIFEGKETRVLHPLTHEWIIQRKPAKLGLPD